VRRGGGYKPHLARQVFDKQYGDCKDKANLMRTMLKALGIPSYMMSIWPWTAPTCGPSGPRPGSSTTHHCDQGRRRHAVARHRHASAARPLVVLRPHRSLHAGRRYPIREQGSYALLDGAELEPLVKMPFLPASANRIETTIGARLSDRGP